MPISSAERYDFELLEKEWYLNHTNSKQLDFRIWQQLKIIYYHEGEWSLSIMQHNFQTLEITEMIPSHIKSRTLWWNADLSE